MKVLHKPTHDYIKCFVDALTNLCVSTRGSKDRSQKDWQYLSRAEGLSRGTFAPRHCRILRQLKENNIAVKKILYYIVAMSNYLIDVFDQNNHNRAYVIAVGRYYKVIIFLWYLQQRRCDSRNGSGGRCRNLHRSSVPGLSCW